MWKYGGHEDHREQRERTVLREAFPGGRRRSGITPSATRLPSSGGIGSMLNTASAMFRRKPMLSRMSSASLCTIEALHQPHHEHAQESEHQVRERAGCRRDHHAGAHVELAREARRVHRHGLGPAERHAHQRQQHRADRIDVHERVEREPTEALRRCRHRGERRYTRAPTRGRRATRSAGSRSRGSAAARHCP